MLCLLRYKSISLFLWVTNSLRQTSIDFIFRVKLAFIQQNTKMYLIFLTKELLIVKQPQKSLYNIQKLPTKTSQPQKSDSKFKFAPSNTIRNTNAARESLRRRAAKASVTQLARRLSMLLHNLQLGCRPPFCFEITCLLLN